MTNTEHPYADLLRAIADGKKIVDSNGKQVDHGTALRMITLANVTAESLKIAPEVIIVNGIEVPAPYRGAMSYGQEYWVAFPNYEGHAVLRVWYNDALDRMAMARGLIHLNSTAAVAHSRAMCAASMEGGAA